MSAISDGSSSSGSPGRHNMADTVQNSPSAGFRSKRSKHGNNRAVTMIQRAPFTQAAFDELHLKSKLEELTFSEKLKMKCSKMKMAKVVSSYLPIVNVLRYYHIKQNILIDILSGVTIGILHIPQALAFGALTSVKVENGLYTSIWPVILYVIFGTSAHVSIGTSAVICIVTAAVVDRQAEKFQNANPHLMALSGNNTLEWEDIPEFMDFKEETAMSIAFISGAILMAMGLFKLGFITAYLSDSFFSAFTSGAGVHIATSQIPAILGLKVPRYGGMFKIIKTYGAIFGAIQNTNFCTLIIGVISAVVILLVKDCVNERFKHKMLVPIPIELFVVIGATVVSYFAKLNDLYGVDIVSSIPNNIPAPVLPNFHGVEDYFVDCLVIAILIFANTIAMAKICAKRHNYEVDDSQELIAYGICNFGSSFLRCFPSSVAPPRSMVASSMNTKSTLNGIFSAALLILLTLVISSLFEPLPKSALATIVVVALKGLFMQLKDCVKFWKVNKIDFVIWFFTLVSVVFLDIDFGLAVGVIVSLLTVVFQAQFARGYRVGMTTSDEASVEHKRYKDSVETSGIEVYRFHSNLFFANAEIFRTSLYNATINPRKLLRFIKKQEKKRSRAGMAPNRESYLFKEFINTKSNFSKKREMKNVSLKGFHHIDETGHVIDDMSPCDDKQQPSTICLMDTTAFKIDDNGRSPPRTRQRRPSFSSSPSEDSLDIKLDPDDGEEIVTEEKIQRMRRIHHVIIDFSTMNYVDISGASVIGHIYNEYDHVNIALFLANVSYDVRQTLFHAGVFDIIPEENVFLDIYDAIVVAKEAMVLPIPKEGLANFNFEEAAEDKYVTHIGE